MSFVVKGIWTNILKENAPLDCDKQIDDMVVYVIPNESVDALNFEYVETKIEPCPHPHKKKLPKHHHSWSHISPSLRLLQKRCERLNSGPMSTIKIVFGWIDGWSWHHWHIFVVA